MRDTGRGIATRLQVLTTARSKAPHLAGGLLAVAGALLTVALLLAAMQGVPLGPFLMWLFWMAPFGVVLIAVMAVAYVRRLEMALERERRRFRVLSEAVPGGVCQFDTEGDLVFTNSACDSLFGGLPQGWSGGPVFRSVHPDDRARLRACWQAAQVGRRAFRQEFRLAGLGGAERRLSLSAVPLTAPGGCGQGYLCCLTEVFAAAPHIALQKAITDGLTAKGHH